jgi:hypothetical protein
MEDQHTPLGVLWEEQIRLLQANFNQLLKTGQLAHPVPRQIDDLPSNQEDK